MHAIDCWHCRRPGCPCSGSSAPCAQRRGVCRSGCRRRGSRPSPPAGEPDRHMPIRIDGIAGTAVDSSTAASPLRTVRRPASYCTELATAASARPSRSLRAHRRRAVRSSLCALARPPLPCRAGSAGSANDRSRTSTRSRRAVPPPPPHLLSDTLGGRRPAAGPTLVVLRLFTHRRSRAVIAANHRRCDGRRPPQLPLHLGDPRRVRRRLRAELMCHLEVGQRAFRLAPLGA